jgi:uncharacterized protein YjiS (DUF1127 family)
MHGIPALAIVVSRMGALVNPVIDRFRRRRQRRRNAVSHLDDHLLRDIGLMRSDVIARRILDE